MASSDSDRPREMATVNTIMNLTRDHGRHCCSAKNQSDYGDWWSAGDTMFLVAASDHLVCGFSGRKVQRLTQVVKMCLFP